MQEYRALLMANEEAAAMRADFFSGRRSSTLEARLGMRGGEESTEIQCANDQPDGSRPAFLPSA